MDPSDFKEFTLTRIADRTHNTKEFHYHVSDGPDAKVPLHPTASCVMIKVPLGDVFRPYTPVNQDERSLHFIIKIYPNGQLTQYLANQKLGDKVLIKGPLPKLPYEPNKWSHIGMICGGTGINPMWQVIVKILHNPQDTTEISLLYSSSTEEDIILRQELEEFARQHPNFKLHLVVSKPSNSWSGLTGRIGKDMIQQYIPPPNPQSLVLVCGPDAMQANLAGPKAPDKTQGPLTGVLKELGYTESMVYKF